MGRQSNINSDVYDYMYRIRDSFDSTTYELFESMRAIQGTSGSLSAIDVGDVYLTVKALEGHYHDIVLTRVLS